MAKWIADGSIVCTEVHEAHAESHNTISGNPSYKAILEIAWADVKAAEAKLLGGPALWPKDTMMKNVVCVDFQVLNDRGLYATDGDQEVVNYVNNALCEVTYLPRPGRYLIDYSNQPVYWHDEPEALFETMPMDHTQLIWGLTTESTPTQPFIDLTSTDVPVIFNPGSTLTHTIEGWARLTDIDSFVGTVHTGTYYSPQLRRTFPARTLMLDSYTALPQFSFRSYRFPGTFSDPLWDPSGEMTITLKLVYKYKANGWKKFRRINADSNTFDYYHIHYRESPHDQLIPFPPLPHDIFLAGTL